MGMSWACNGDAFGNFNVSLKNELRIYCSHDRSHREHKELWMMEENYQIIPPNHIIGRVLVWLKDVSRPEFYDFQILEILYRDAATNRIKIRPVNLWHHHPSEYVVALNLSPVGNMKVFKFMIDIYNDDFGTFRNVYHSLGGIYIQIGNMPFNERKLLKNHFILGFVSFGGCFDEFIKPFIKEMKVLENGKIMNIQGNECLVIASLGDIT